MINYISAESVGKGHPDKICDQIADAILDELLKKDKDSRVAVEVFATNRLIVIGGEINTHAYVDVVKIAWSVLFDLGYSENDFSIVSSVNSQSSEISALVDHDSEIAAGDQGIMYGYATNETSNYMPLAITLAHRFLKVAEKVRKHHQIKELKADMKSQVTLAYETGKPTRIAKLVLALQHQENLDVEKFKKNVKRLIIDPVVKEFNLNEDFEIFINHKGPFSLGGPIADTGLTGRKIIVDTYGGAARHGGGAFSGKDYSKVDRSGAYAARWVAKNLVAAGIADKLELQIAYVIGRKTPISYYIETFDSEKIAKEKIVEIIEKVFDLSVQAIIDQFDMKNISYKKLAVFGHVGRSEKKAPWEKLDKVSEIKAFL
ncbi:methionine adenosyltransferase [Mycoplasmopsis agassizii]|uniref:Methionine adenosyltransferase n=1 Tax=Mycoplasmopsis agassizii TaxID=33922 RepID=A0A269THY3_9BACT|nr:methionine adenosyltransferase [Mycoplasmopsis agassizii]PAK21054.1 methionine adenosyltransferase [Mycoplasmopsis agassizii]